MPRYEDVRALATENRLGKVSTDILAIDVTFTLDTSIYASGDLLADMVEVAGASLGAGRYCELVSMVLHDEDDQGAALVAVFSQASTTLGTLNSAPNISDANARVVQGHLAFATTDYVDIGGSKVGTKTCNIPMKSGATTASLYVGLVNLTGTPTYTVAGVRATMFFRRH